jgi:hypothetical protein
MRYICLIYENEALNADRSDEDQNAIFGEYFAFTRNAQDAGVMEAGDPLEQSTTATTVRVREGKVTHTDGPFAETREQLGGFYILDCKDLDEALTYAAQIPSAKYGSIEVRPIMNIEVPG